MVEEIDERFDEDEFRDTEEEPHGDLLHAIGRLDPSVLAHPTVAQSIVLLGFALAALAWPGRTDIILARIIAVALVVSGGLALGAAVRGRRPAGAGPALLAMAAGAWILLARRDSSEILALLVGLVVIASAVAELARVFGARRAGIDGWRVARAAMLGALGGTLLIAGPALLELAVVVVAIAAAVVAIVAIVASLDADQDGVASLADSERLVRDWLAERSKSADDRRALYDKLLYEGPAAPHRLARFAILMSFASVIASMGVITDSTAVVIGAMLIAPLMTPLMASSMSLVMGWPSRLRRSVSIALLGIGIAISIGLLLGLAVPATIDTATNSQILSRASPTTLDLITALAAGAAGAYGLSRPDVSDSLPGVAIAISLVPPLTVVGIAFSQGDVGAGNGALLLFATNALAILTMGGVTFVLTGVTPIERVADNQRRVRTWLAAVAGLAALVFGALFLNGATIARNSVEQGATERVAAEWVADYADSALVEVALDDEIVRVVLIGPPDAGFDPQSLADRLADELDRPVALDLRHVIQDRLEATAG